MYIFLALVPRKEMGEILSELFCKRKKKRGVIMGFVLYIDKNEKEKNVEDLLSFSVSFLLGLSIYLFTIAFPNF